MTHRRRRTRRLMAFGTGLLIAAGLALPGAAKARLDLQRPELRDRPQVPLPSARQIEEIRRQNLEALWNARGTVQAELGSRHTLSIQAVADPGIHFSVLERSGHVVIRAGEHMFTGGETSLELTLAQESGAWRIVEAWVKVEGEDFRLREGSITVAQFDPNLGIFDATFELLMQTEGRQPIDLIVREGRLSVRKSR